MDYRYLKKLENERLSINKKLKIALFLVIGIAIILFFLINKSLITNFKSSPFSIFFSLLVAFMAYIAYKSYISVGFNFDFKHKIMAKIVKSISPDLKYIVDKYISYDEFSYPSMYKYPDIYRGNDLIYGNIDGIEIKFSDINTQEIVQVPDRNGRSKKVHRRIFQGICFIADFNKHFSSRTYISSSNETIMHGEKAYMDDSEFEREFDVFTDDQINARYIITPLFMQQFLKLKNIFDCPINAAFIENKIYIYIEFNKDSFEPDIKQSLIGENSIVKRYKDEILDLLNLVKELNLNRKIFAKVD
ncbi:hydrogenase expression/formation protein [Campylobacter geochelonis]|nr:hydrogenase expression/formation protein [Campylobacter geochelonis]